MKSPPRAAVLLQLLILTGGFARAQTAPTGQKAVLADSNVFNPAMGVVLDGVLGHTERNQGEAQFRSAELNLQASVDPFARVYAIINGTSGGVAVEEAAVLVPALPGGFSLRAGRYFANFGRFPKFHDHELPFVNRTASLDTFISGEARADGVELVHLFCAPFFLQGTLGVTRLIGAENTRLEETGGTGHTTGRGWDAFTHNARLFTFVPLGDEHGLDVGASAAVTPRHRYIGGVRVDRPDTTRWLTGLDFTYRYEPLEKNVYRKFTWGTELFHNSERRRDALAIDTNADGVGDTDDFPRKQAVGGYSYIESRFAPRWSAGGFGDITENLDNTKLTTRTAGTFLNYHPSEFQKVRLQYSVADPSNGSNDNQVFLQWVAIIGRHAHTFKDR